MQTANNSNENPRGLALQSLKITSYQILSVEVVKDQTPRFAVATVITTNSQGQWDDSTIHLIELKHCYNKYSKGPKQTQYENLPGLILTVSHIAPPIYGNLDTITWSLFSPEVADADDFGEDNFINYL